MKKSYLLLPLTLLFSGALFAADEGGFKAEGQAPAPSEQKSGYRGINDTVAQTTVAKLADTSDGRWVSLKGNIVRQLGNNRYQFRDASGSIDVQIQPSIWRDQEVKPDDLVTLSGKLSKSGKQRSIEVANIRRL